MVVELGQPDMFAGCAQSQFSGGTELLDMSSYLLNPEGGGVEEAGASRYGAIVVHPSTVADPADPTADATLAYNILINTTARPSPAPTLHIKHYIIRNVCKVSLLFSAVYAKSLYYVVPYMQSVFIM